MIWKMLKTRDGKVFVVICMLSIAIVSAFALFVLYLGASAFGDREFKDKAYLEQRFGLKIPPASCMHMRYFHWQDSTVYTVYLRTSISNYRDFISQSGLSTSKSIYKNSDDVNFKERIRPYLTWAESRLKHSNDIENISKNDSEFHGIMYLVADGGANDVMVYFSVYE